MEELRFDEIFTQLKDKYKTVFTYTGFPDGIVIYRPLTRSQYYELFENEQLMDVEREDIVCYNCILYPENFDIGAQPAGLIADLAQKILDASFMSKRGREILYLNAVDNMQNVDKQISCVIHEAFPEYDIEDIDNWDMVRTMDFLARSEWILKNIHGRGGLDMEKLLDAGSNVSFKQDDPRLFNEEKQYFDKLREQREKPVSEEIKKPKQTVKRPQRRKQQMSEDELKAMFPEAFVNQGDENSIREVALSGKNPHDMTLAELAELRNNN